MTHEMQVEIDEEQGVVASWQVGDEKLHVRRILAFNQIRFPIQSMK